MEIDCGLCTLRPLESTDAESIAFYANNFNIWVNLRDAFPHPYTLVDAHAFIELNRMTNPSTSLGIHYQEECIGVIGFVLQPDVYRKTADFGYWLGEPFWGRGIMTRAAQKTIAYIFENFDLVRLSASVFSTNKASIRVLEKAGFVCEGIFKSAVFKNGRILDEYRFGLLRDQQ